MKDSTRFRTPDWGILIRQDLDEVLAPIHRLQWNIGMIGVLILSPLMFLLIWSAKHIQRAQQHERVARAAAQQSEAHTQLILTSAGDGIFGLDTDGRTMFVNPAATAMLGYAADELIGAHMHVTVHHTKPDGSPYPREDCPMYAAFKDGEVHHVEDEVLWRKDGTSFPIEYTSTPMRNERGNIEGAVVIFKDSTNRKEVESILRERNRLLALDVEIGQAVNQSHDIQSLLQGCTEALVKNLDAAFARIWTLNATNDVLELQASAGLYNHLNGAHGRVPVGQFKIGKIASEKQPHLTNTVIGDPRVPEQEWAKREGLVAFAGYPLMRGHDVLGVMGLFSRHPLMEHTLSSLQTVADRITSAIESHDAKTAHLTVSALNEQILISAKEGIWGLDLEGQTTFVNPAAARMLGYQTDELLGTLMHMKVHHTKPDGSPYPREDCPMYAAYRVGSTQTIEHEVLWRKDGTSFPVEYTSTPIRDEFNQVKGAVVTFRDVTYRKQHQDELENLSARLQLATQSAEIGVWDWDVVNNILTWDDQMYTLYGLPRDVFSGTYEAWTAALHPDDHDRADREMHDAMRAGSPFNSRYRVIRPDSLNSPSKSLCHRRTKRPRSSDKNDGRELGYHTRKNRRGCSHSNH